MWFKIDDHFYDHPKFVALTDSATVLWMKAGAYCARHGTGGTIHINAIKSLQPRSWRKDLDQLMEAGLWTTWDGIEFQFHDWADYNPTAQEAAERKARNAEAIKLRNRKGGCVRHHGKDCWNHEADACSKTLGEAKVIDINQPRPHA